MAAQLNIYEYKGVDKRGRPVRGEISGAGAAVVRAQLLKQGIRPKAVRKKPKPLFGAGKKISPLDIAIFTRQMATMMKAGVPLVQSFDIVADGVDNPRLAEMVRNLRDEVSAGASFAGSLRKQPRYFDELFCNLVESGEQSGSLETMLDRVAIYKEKTEQLKGKIKKAMTYPSIVLLVAVVVTGILLIKVVPQFAETFSSFGANLPAFTLFVLSLSGLAQAYWLHLLGAVVIAIFLFRYLKRTSRSFAVGLDRLMLKLPVLGNILYQAIIARFARTLSTTFAAGVPLIDALDSVAGATGNAVYESAVFAVRDDVATGTQLNQALRSTRLFPSMLLQMTAIGEESGALDSMLDKVASYYEEQVDNSVSNLTTLLEPMIMAILGVLVGGLMIAMYLPIFQLGQVV